METRTGWIKLVDGSIDVLYKAADFKRHPHYCFPFLSHAVRGQNVSSLAPADKFAGKDLEKFFWPKLIFLHRNRKELNSKPLPVVHQLSRNFGILLFVRINMICNVCFSMLRGQVGRRWRGSFDLRFDHQATLGSLKQSADMACCVCHRLWEDMPVIDDRPKVWKSPHLSI